MPYTTSGRYRPLLAVIASRQAELNSLGWRGFPWSVRQAMIVVTAQIGRRVIDVDVVDGVPHLRIIDMVEGDADRLVAALAQWEIDLVTLTTADPVGGTIRGTLVVGLHEDPAQIAEAA